jgi:tetratricopeptide (TPR) repeat protein
MHGCMRPVIAAAVALMLGQQAALAQPLELPRLVPPLRLSPEERDRREALKKYAEGLLSERDDRLLDALKCYEEAVRLDPRAPAVYKTQVGLLLALDRAPEAMIACRKALALDKGDPELWYVSARLHKACGLYADAQADLRQALATEHVRTHPEQAQQLYLDLGELLELAHDYGPAADAYLRAAQILEHPDRLLDKGNFSREAIVARSAETYERIGNLYRKAKKYPEAIDALRKAQERAPERVGRIGFQLAQLCLEQGRLPEALAHVDAYLRMQPPGLEGYEFKIDLLRKLNQEASVLPWLEQAAQADRYNTGLRLLLARACAAAQQPARAEQIYKELSEAGPGPEVYRGWFQLYRAEPARVLAMLNGAVERGAASNVAAVQARAMVAALREEGELARELVQSVQPKLGQDPALRFETLQFLAVVAERQQLLGEAERLYRVCRMMAPAGAETLTVAGLLRVLNKQRKFEEVVKLCTAGLAGAAPLQQLIYYNDLARASAQLERYEEALRHADQALLLASEDNKLMLQLLRVRILAMAERFADAEAECQTLLRERVLPGDVLEIRYTLSGIYTAAKQLDKSEEQLAQILRLDPNNAPANNDLGYVWADSGKNLAEAEDMIRRAVDQDRRRRQQATAGTTEEGHDNAAYIDSLGWVLYRRGKLEDARQELERATTLPDSDDPVIWDHLGDVYYRLRRAEDARTAWERALRIYEQGRRRRTEERYHELQRKLKMLREQG